MLEIFVIAVFSVSFVVFVALFGRLPAFRSASCYLEAACADTFLRKTPIGVLHHFLCVKLLAQAYDLDAYLTGGRTRWSLNSISTYLLRTNHPVVLV